MHVHQIGTRAAACVALLSLFGCAPDARTGDPAPAVRSPKVAARAPVASKPPFEAASEPARYSSRQHRDYAAAKKHVAGRRAHLAKVYRRAHPDKRHDVFVQAERAVYESLVRDLFGFWLKTPWNYNGTTQTPGKGKIACGYFVTTVLRDAGFNVERAKLAQQASEKIIKSLTLARNIKRYSNTPLKAFVDSVKRMGRGVYIVGLDSHVGFLVVDGRDVWFVHSSSLPPSCVVREKAIESTSLRTSKYRVVGAVTGDRALLWKWLAGIKIATRTK
jgi:hypothetical protein